MLKKYDTAYDHSSQDLLRSFVGEKHLETSFFILALLSDQKFKLLFWVIGDFFKVLPYLVICRTD